MKMNLVFIDELYCEAGRTKSETIEAVYPDAVNLNVGDYVKTSKGVYRVKLREFDLIYNKLTITLYQLS